MPTRRTKRGGERTPLAGDYDVDRLRRELRRARGRTRAGRARAGGPAGCCCSTATRSASARPPPAPRRPPGSRRSASSARSARRSTRSSSTPRTPRRASPCRGPSPPSTTRSSARLLDDQNDARVRDRDRQRARAGARRRARSTVQHRPRRGDARRWSWTRSAGGGCSAAAATSRRTRRSRAGSRCIRTARAASSRSGSTARSSRPATAGASPPATRCASASARSTRASTSRSRPSTSPRQLRARPAVRYQGNWIPHRLRAATEDGRLLRRRLGRSLPAADRGGHPHRASTSASRSGASCAGWSRGARRARPRCAATAPSPHEHEWKFRWMLRAQRLVPRVPPRLLALATARDGHAQRSPTGRSATTSNVAPPELRHRRASRTEPAQQPRHALSRDLEFRPTPAGEPSPLRPMLAAQQEGGIT